MNGKGVSAARGLLLAALAALHAAAAAAPPTADAQLTALADRMVALQVGYAPALAYFIGAPTSDHRRWPDRSPAGIAALNRSSDQLLAALKAIDPKTLSAGAPRSLHASMLERLEADRQLRVCRSELWAVNHMGGWQIELAEIAGEQPVGTAAERVQALERWATLPKFVDQEIANARAGLRLGYSSPKPAVLKVIKQLDGLISAPPAQSPLHSPATRAKDPAFSRTFARIVSGPVHQALARYRNFLRSEYLPRARDALGVSANPNGAACYRASLRSYTTLDRSPEEVFRIGQQTVSRNKAEVQALGRKLFGTDDLPTIIRKVVTAPDNLFASEEDYVLFSRKAVERSREKTAPYFLSIPAQEVRVEPFPAFRRGSGASPYYEAQVDPAKPAFYRINADEWRLENRGTAERTAVHEAYPGHHMQIAFASGLGAHPAANLLSNSAYAEGWGRYSEMLAEEAGIYETPYALVTRRLWPARGMVMDPALHLFGWTREKIIAFMRESGRYTGTDADDLVDRMAMTPGQLTAYDSGGLEIRALREEAKAALGARFDIRQFHQRVLENGAIPLAALRANIQAWIAAEKAR